MSKYWKLFVLFDDPLSCSLFSIAVNLYVVPETQNVDPFHQPKVSKKEEVHMPR